MNYKVKVKGDITKVTANGEGCWNSMVKGEVLLKFENTGNGFIAKFPSYSSTNQDNYICLDYDEAHELIFALVEQKSFLEISEIDYLISRLENQKSLIKERYQLLNSKDDSQS